MSDVREPFSEAARLLRAGVESHAFPAACIEVGRRDSVLWNAAFGAYTFDPSARIATPETIFDLASLTKVLATTTLAMRAVDAGRLPLDAPVAHWLPDWTGADREGVTVRQLLAHSSGLAAYLPLYRTCTGWPEFERAICTLPLEYPPGTQARYSDLGFILLGFILEKAAPSSETFTGDAGAFDPSRSLAAQFRRIASYVTTAPLTFNPPRAWREHTAPTEMDRWRGRLLAGEVHDENCWALGGAAGHAGLFGTAAAVGAFARALLATRAKAILAEPATLRAFFTPSDVPGSSRALGWDTMRPASSCGRLLSRSAVGHTGFTGTSLWIDPDRDLYIVLLTNRVHPTRQNDAIREIRPRIHEAVVADSERAGAWHDSSPPDPRPPSS